MMHLSRGGGLTTNAAGKVNVTGHDGNTLAVDSTQVNILKQRDEVGLGSLLEGSDGSRLEAKVSLALLGNLTDETLEGELADQELSRLLVATDLTERNGAGAIAMGLLDARGRGRRLAGSLGGDHLAGSLTTGGLASSVLGTSHC